VEWETDPIQDKATETEIVVVAIVKISKIENISKMTHWHHASGFFVGINTRMENLHGS